MPRKVTGWQGLANKLPSGVAVGTVPLCQRTGNRWRQEGVQGSGRPAALLCDPGVILSLSELISFFTEFSFSCSLCQALHWMRDHKGIKRFSLLVLKSGGPLKYDAHVHTLSSGYQPLLVKHLEQGLHV